MAPSSGRPATESRLVPEDELYEKVEGLLSDELEDRIDALEDVAGLLDDAVGARATQIGAAMRTRGALRPMLELLDDDDVYAQQAALQVLGNLASDAVDPHSRRTKEAVLGLGLFDRVLAHLHNEKGATRVLALGAVQNLCVLPAFAVLLDAAGVAPKLRELAATRSRDAPANQAHYARGCLANMEAAIAAKAGKADTAAAPVADADADADAAPSAAAPSAAGSSLQHGGLPDLSVGGARRTPAEPLYARAREHRRLAAVRATTATGSPVLAAGSPSAGDPSPASAWQSAQWSPFAPQGARGRGGAARRGRSAGRSQRPQHSPVVQEVLDRAKANREAATPPSPQAPEGAPASPAASPPASASPAAWKPLKACGEAAIADAAGGGAPAAAAADEEQPRRQLAPRRLSSHSPLVPRPGALVEGKTSPSSPPERLALSFARSRLSNGGGERASLNNHSSGTLTKMERGGASSSNGSTPRDADGGASNGASNGGAHRDPPVARKPKPPPLTTAASAEGSTSTPPASRPAADSEELESPLGRMMRSLVTSVGSPAGTIAALWGGGGGSNGGTPTPRPPSAVHPTVKRKTPSPARAPKQRPLPSPVPSPEEPAAT